MIFQAVVSNKAHPEYGQATIPFPIPDSDYDHTIELLEGLAIGSPTDQDCRVDELNSGYPILNRLVVQSVNVDELDYLAKRLESFCSSENIQFQAMACRLGLADIKDLINLTFCCQQATVITDFSNLEKIGKDHRMSLNGGTMPAEEYDRLDGAGGIHMAEQKFIEVKDLVVEYTSDGDIVQAVNGISLSLDRGETLGLVGETGAGKTTIAKAILRILPQPPARVKSGTIRMEGQDLLTIPEKEMLKIRGNKISMIFQDPMTALNPVMSVGKQITEVVALHNNCTKEEAKQRTVEMLEMVGIPAERYVEFPHQFSGGMKQRVVIAMALACNPELLLADEPTTALDVTIQAQVLDMIRDLRNQFNTAMILITHDLGIVAETCDKVAVVYAGHIVESGTKEDIFKHVAHPYTQGLFNSIPKLNDSSPRLKPILGMPPDPTNLPKGCVFAPRCQYATETCRQGNIPSVEIAPGHFCQCLRAQKEV